MVLLHKDSEGCVETVRQVQSLDAQSLGPAGWQCMGLQSISEHHREQWCVSVLTRQVTHRSSVCALPTWSSAGQTHGDALCETATHCYGLTRWCNH